MLELSRFLLNDTYCENFRHNSGENNLEIHYMGTELFVNGIKALYIFEGSYNMKDLFDFGILSERNKIFSDENEKVFGQFKIEAPKVFA